MLNWFKKIIDQRYVQTLEEEVQRLRGENRALMNSLLGTAGFPPVEFPAASVPRELPRMRRRSWHQIQAWRASEAANERSTAQDASGSVNRE